MIVRIELNLLVAGFLAVSIGFGQAPGTPHAASAGTIAEGRDLFNQYCTVCHGMDGGPGDRGPAMFGERRSTRRTAAELFHAIDNGIDGSEMPPMGLSEEENWKLVAFITSLRAKAKDVPITGDVGKGASVFWGKAECGRCHAVRGRGGLLGPELSNLAAEMSLRQIRDALTAPKPHPPLGYRPVRVVTRDGRTLTGVSKNEHNFSLQLLGDDNRLHLFTSEEIEEVVYAEESLMPTDFERRLSEHEFEDLLAFLSRLTRAEPAGPGGDSTTGKEREPH